MHREELQTNERTDTFMTYVDTQVSLIEFHFDMFLRIRTQLVHLTP